MTRFVIGADVAVHLARAGTTPSGQHELLAPTLFRSQVLTRLYEAVRRGEMTRAEANRDLKYVRALRIRLLGDRVLQENAWKYAEQLGLPDTLDAEYVALTRLQANAFVTLDQGLARVVREVVTVAPVEALTEP